MSDYSCEKWWRKLSAAFIIHKDFHETFFYVQTLAPRSPHKWKGTLSTIDQSTKQLVCCQIVYVYELSKMDHFYKISSFYEVPVAMHSDVILDYDDSYDAKAWRCFDTGDLICAWLLLKTSRGTLAKIPRFKNCREEAFPQKGVDSWISGPTSWKLDFLMLSEMS